MDNESELDVHSKRVGVKDESTVSKSKKSSVHRVLRDHDIVVCMDENCPLSFPSKPKMLAHMCLSHGYRAKLTEMLPEYFTLENKLINKKMKKLRRCNMCKKLFMSVPGACNHLGSYHKVIFKLIRRKAERMRNFQRLKVAGKKDTSFLQSYRIPKKATDEKRILKKKL